MRRRRHCVSVLFSGGQKLEIELSETVFLRLRRAWQSEERYYKTFNADHRVFIRLDEVVAIVEYKNDGSDDDSSTQV